MASPEVAQPRRVSDLLQQGVGLHQQGRSAEALACYEEVLRLEPGNFDACHLAGVIAAQGGQADRAIELIGRAVAMQPRNAAALGNLGLAFAMRDRFQEAFDCHDRVIALGAGNAESHYGCGLALAGLGRFEEAVSAHDRAIALKPGHAPAWGGRGVALAALRRFAEAVPSFDRAVALKPDYVEAFFNRGNSLRELGRLEDALASFSQATALRPGYAQAWFNRGAVLAELKRMEEALASYDRAIESDGPGSAQAWNNRGIALRAMERLEEAVASYDRAIQIDPSLVEAHSNRGNALLAVPRLADAIASYDRAQALVPDFVDAHWGKSLALLLAGDLRQGFAEYEWRWKNDRAGFKPRVFAQPQWLGEPGIAGRTVLLHSEQGLGDAIQFCRYAPLVKALGARVVLQVPQALCGLLSGLEGVDQVVARGKRLPPFDFHCPLMSLPLALRTDISSIPLARPYLRAPGAVAEAWAAKLGARTRPRVGLAWSGSTTHKRDHHRSLLLRDLLPHLPAGLEYVSLQKDLREADVQDLARSGIRHYGDQLADFSHTAALGSLMDTVVSVDTSVAHLSAALGRPTWVLLPFVPDWRWLLDRDDSPWYPSMRLYRQDVGREWGPVLRRVAADLEELAARK